MRLSLLQRLTALMLLMAYTVTGTSVMPAMMALAAWMDGEHEVVISQSESGTSVTLHHVDGSYTPDVEDHQKMLGKFLVSFCRAAGEGDHQMKASRCDSRTGTQRESLEKITQSPAEINLTATLQLISAQFNPSRDDTRRSMHGAETPPGKHGAMPMLAKVRLLI